VSPVVMVALRRTSVRAAGAVVGGWIGEAAPARLAWLGWSEAGDELLDAQGLLLA
jgi:hypothetical protein